MRPGPPGGIPIAGITGEFSASEGADGLFDLSHPVEGSFVVQPNDLDLGNRLLTFAVRQWLGDQPVHGRLGEARPVGDGEYAMGLIMAFRGDEHHLEGTSRVDPPEGGRSVLRGGMALQAGALGLPLPSFLLPSTRLAWAIALEQMD